MKFTKICSKTTYSYLFVVTTYSIAAMKLEKPCFCVSKCITGLPYVRVHKIDVYKRQSQYIIKNLKYSLVLTFFNLEPHKDQLFL